MKALAALAGAVLTLAACYSLGSAAAARFGLKLARAEKMPLALVLGAAILHLGVFGALALGIAYKPVLLLLLALALASGISGGQWRLPADQFPVPRGTGRIHRATEYAFAAIAALFGFIYFIHAWAPEISPDGAGYHLGLVARFLRAHGFERIHTFYYSLSAGVELIFLPAFAIGRHSAAALVQFGFLIALALAIRAYGVRIGRPLAGSAAALLVFLSPVAGMAGTTAYVDAAAAAAVFATFYFVQLWDESPQPRLLFAIGLLAGFCYAAKYTAFIIAFYALGFVIWRTRGIRGAMTVAAGSLVMVLPWMAKNAIIMGNPVAPFANAVFRTPYIHVEFERYLAAYLRTYGLQSLWSLPYDVTTRGEATQGVIGPIFFAAPVVLLALRLRAGRRIAIPCALLGAVYFTNIGARFFLPVLPFLSLLMALALDAAVPLLGLMILAHALLSWPPVLHRYSRGWSLPDAPPVRAALRLIPEDRYLSDYPEYAWARMIERQVPANEPVFARTPAADSYTERNVLLSWSSSAALNLQDALDIGWNPGVQPGKTWTYRFPPQTVRRLRVVQTGLARNPGEQWSVHEVRFFRNGAELPREPSWRVRAWPNPWDIGMAFDNSPATRWRSWETMRPGMYIETDFGRGQAADEVRVELSADEWNVRMEIEVPDNTGKWRPLAARATEVQTRYAGSLRRAAMYEFRNSGVHYLFLTDTDWGAKEVAESPESWGLKLLDHSHGGRIYRVLP
jgi:hypothetical protein